MEPTDLQRVQAAYAGLQADGTPDADLFDPDVEWHNAPELPGAGVHRGVEAMMADIRAQSEAWEDRRFVPTEVIETDDGAIVFLKITARGRSSGVPVDQEVAHVLTMRDDKVVRVEAFIDRDEALRAAGLKDG